VQSLSDDGTRLVCDKILTIIDRDNGITLKHVTTLGRDTCTHILTRFGYLKQFILQTGMSKIGLVLDNFQLHGNNINEVHAYALKFANGICWVKEGTKPWDRLTFEIIREMTLLTECIRVYSLYRKPQTRNRAAMKRFKKL
jgi:hypothetical protein